MSRLSGSARVRVIPHGFQEEPPQSGMTYRDFDDVAAAFTDFADVVTNVAQYDDLMFGHPGFAGGLPRRPMGVGCTFGDTDANGVEWWLTNAEGLDGSTEWEQQTVNPAWGDGTWLLDVRGRQREINIEGTLVGHSREALDTAKRMAAATLASWPRTGWVWYEPLGFDEVRRLPVAMSGPVKVRHESSAMAKVQLTVRGVDIGTPGKGAHLEGAPQRHEFTSLANATIGVGGLVPTEPVLLFYGPMDTGATVTLGDYVITLNRAILPAHILVVNCATRQVLDREGPAGNTRETPDRDAVSFYEGRWPILPTGAVDVYSSFSGAGSRIVMDVVPLW